MRIAPCRATKKDVMTRLQSLTANSYQSMPHFSKDETRAEDPEKSREKIIMWHHMPHRFVLERLHPETLHLTGCGDR